MFAALSLLLLATTAVVSPAQAMSRGGEFCPSVCQCKWKGGKQTVECIDRQLITIPENIDQTTQVLDMSGNNLQQLPRETFIRLDLLNLQKLFLRNCKLGQIDEEAFKGLTNLVELDLSHNLLTAIPSSTFEHITSLRDLTLSKNPIQKIEPGAFQTVPGLVKLDMSHCDLLTIAPQAFEGLELLHSLKLNGNKLSELRPRTVETLSRLHGVELHDNPWMCDCRLRAAKIWLAENNIPYPVAPTCSGGPERVIDRTFDDLQIDDFACRPEMLPVNRFIEAFSGDNATIVCRTGAVPSANINWYWNGRVLTNNSAFSAFQKVHIFESGEFEKASRLVITNAQDSDSSEFYCVAENRAGSAEANFTLHVTMRAGITALGNGQIAGLSIALVVLILFILLVTLFLLVRLRRMPFSESKTPGGQLDTVITTNANSTAATTTTVSPIQSKNNNLLGHGNNSNGISGKSINHNSNNSGCLRSPSSNSNINHANAVGNSLDQSTLVEPSSIISSSSNTLRGRGSTSGRSSTGIGDGNGPAASTTATNQLGALTLKKARTAVKKYSDNYNASSLDPPPADWKTVGDPKCGTGPAAAAAQCAAASGLPGAAAAAATAANAASSAINASGAGQQQQLLMNNLRAMNSPSLALGGSGTLLSPSKTSSSYNNNNFNPNGATTTTSMNPVQKPPRLNDFGGGGGGVGGGGYENGGLMGCKYGSPTSTQVASSALANLNNPDLINDTRGSYGSNDNFAKLLLHHKQESGGGSDSNNKTDSGEYVRAQGCDSLYPSGLWETPTASSSVVGMDFNQELYSLNHYSQQQQHQQLPQHFHQQSSLSSINYSDKTPILGHGSSLSNCSSSSAGGGAGGSLGTMLINRDAASGGVVAAEFISRTLPRSQLHNKAQQHPVNNQFTSSSASSIIDSPATSTSGGYPADYGLPIVAGAEHEVQKSFREPLQQPPGMPTNAKTLRVWQRGGVPVLPPVTALKRALTSSRNSPDEGYQEGCGTDV